MKLDSAGFPTTLAHLNGLDNLAVDLHDLTRAAITVGYPSRKQSIGHVGPWRARALRHLVHGYVTADLRPTTYFQNLETTEKAAMSFLLAEAFTLLFAQKAMGLWYLVHVRGCGFALSASGLSPKPNAVMKSTDVRPDFIGRKTGQHHVFETKGRQRGLSTKERNRALGQVSAITTVNGSAPTSRVVAAFTFAKSGIRGLIRDPEATASDALVYDEAAAVRKYYAAFRTKRALAGMREIGEFTCLDLGDGLIWGINSMIPIFLQFTTEGESDTAVLTHLQSRQDAYAELDGGGISVGRDGMVFGSAEELKLRQGPRVRPQGG